MSGGFPACAVATGRWRAGLAAPLLAASVLAPSGVTATIQGGPVCLNLPTQTGTVYELSVDATDGTLSVEPAHGKMERRLHQVPSSWVTFGSSVPVTLAPGISGKRTVVLLKVPPGAVTGAYWSDITVTTEPQGQGEVRAGTAASAAFVFTVGPSGTPPPPCDALDLAQSTGKFPAWRGKKPEPAAAAAQT
jgi:hypothetical protein